MAEFFNNEVNYTEELNRLVVHKVRCLSLQEPNECFVGVKAGERYMGNAILMNNISNEHFQIYKLMKSAVSDKIHVNAISQLCNERLNTLLGKPPVRQYNKLLAALRAAYAAYNVNLYRLTKAPIILRVAIGNHKGCYFFSLPDPEVFSYLIVLS